MTPRERVLAALARKQPDRLPIDLGGTDVTSLTGLAWHRLVRHLGLPVGDGPELTEVYQQVVRTDNALRQRFRTDTAALYIEPRQWSVGQFSDGSPCRQPAGWQVRTEPNGDRVAAGPSGRVIGRMPRGGFYFEPVGAPLADCTSPADVDRRRDVFESYDLPGYLDEPIEATATRARRLREQADLAVPFNLFCHLLHGGTSLRGYEQFMMDLSADQAMAEAVLDRLMEVFLTRVDRYAAALRGLVDVVLFCDDLGTQLGPLISPSVYRALIQPRQARLFGHAKRAFGTPVLFHSCGAVRAFIPGLIAAGVDALNPVQVSAEGMDSAGLKRDFGRDLCFWGGGCDTQRVLCAGTPEQVREEVRRRIGDFAPGGGFVFAQVHNIQPDVPAENVVAMLDEAAAL